MKLFVDARWFSQPGQGVVTYIAELHGALAELCDDAVEIVYGVDDLATMPDHLRHPGIAVIALGQRGRLWRALGFPFFLARHGFDVAHFQYATPLLRWKTRYLTTIHDVLFLSHPALFSRAYRWPRWAAFNLATRLASHVLTVSDQSAAEIRRHLAYRGPLSVVYNGWSSKLRDAPPAPPPGLSDGPGRLLLTVGRIEPRKNYERLAAAWTATGLASHGVRLIVVGFAAPGSESIVATLSATPGLVWLDRVSDGELNWLYQNAAGFIYPSLCEGFGIPVLEALRAGCPCAISTTYPLAAIKDSGIVLFDPADPAAIAAALEHLAAGASPPGDTLALAALYDWRKSAGVLRDVLASLAR